MIRNTLLIAVSVSILLSGCSEKPERKAAKEVRKSASQARKTISAGRDEARRIIREGDLAATEAAKNGDFRNAVAISQKEFNKAQNLISDSFEKARSEIEKTLRSNRNSGNAETPALITSGNILFSQALLLQSDLAGSSVPINSNIENISNKVLLMLDLSTLKSQRTKLIEYNKREIRQFRDVLDKGTDTYPGLKAQLQEEEAKLRKIASQIKVLEAKGIKARDKANSIEKSASQKLRAAEALSGEKKLAIQEEAYDLRLSKKKYSMELQSANDKVAILDIKAGIIAPVVKKLLADISSINDKIDAIASAGGNRKLQGDIKAIDAKYNEYDISISKNIGDADAGLKAYLAQIDKVTALLDQALGEYGKVRRGESVLTAKNRKAACYLWKAGVYAESLRAQKNLTSRVKSIITASDAAIAGKLGNIIDTSSEKVDDHAAKALENYELAIKEYEGVSGRGEFACTVLKSRMLAIYGKMTIAEYLGLTAANKADEDRLYAISEDAYQDAEELAKKIKECDPSFDTSITGRMLGGEIDYSPKLRVDLAGLYEEKRKDFQEWNKLKGIEKEAEVDKLIQELEAMKPAEDPDAFERILEPELTQLRAAKKRGFDEPDTGGDPNSLY